MPTHRDDRRDAAAGPAVRRRTRIALAGLVAGAVALTAGMAGAQFDRRLPLPGGRVQLPGPVLTLGCPDPAAQISAEVISPSVGGGPARVRVHGAVRNNGTAYVSGAGQQVAQLYRGPSAMTSRDFPSVGAGASATLITVDVDWLPGGEFNTDFVLRLSYDPDIFIDALPTNDDCRMNNNEARLSAASIDAMVRG